MVTKTQSKNKAQTGTEIVDWEAEMRQQAAVAAGAQRSAGGGGKFFSFKAGVMQYDDNPLPGNQVAVIILADTMENSWYDGPYDPNVPASPKCFAFGHEESEMAPPDAVDNDDYFERQSPQCDGCPRNEWGSAPQGRGKDCKNVMRLAVIPAGQYKQQGKGRNVALEYEPFDDPSHFQKAEVAFMKLPVMSVRHYSKYVKQLTADLGRPPHGVVTNIYLEPDPKSQFAVKFELLDQVPVELLPIVMKRHGAEEATIDFPYQPPQTDEERAPARSNNKLKGKAGAKRR
jgi:hypothetical protein